MKKSRLSPQITKFWRYVFLSLTFMMVVGLYTLAPGGIAEPKISKIFHAPKHQTYDQVNSPESSDVLSVLGQNQDEDRVQDINVPTCHELDRHFNDRNYRLIKNDQKNYDVARVYLAAFPKDFERLGYGAKKDMFLKSLLPLILQANEKITSERKKLLHIMHLKRSGAHLDRRHYKWLSELAVKYRLKKMCLNELCERVDVIPPSLALSQGILETGWGTSVAAKRKNSPFGFTVSNKVLAYESLRHSVEAYVQTLNSHPAYKPLRKIRSGMRKNRETDLCGIALAKGLENYSTRGQAYIREIQQVIKNNNLKQFDGSQLTNQL